MLDFIRDIFASLRQTSLERVKSPVLGAFVFSWLAWNWRSVLTLLFSSESINQRIHYVDSNSGIFTWFIFPIIFTAIICYTLPRINRAITRVQNIPNKETMELSLDAKIDIAKKQQDIADIEAKKKLAIKRQERWIDDEIELIKSKNEQLEDDITRIQAQLSDSSSALADNNKTLSKSIEENKILVGKIESLQLENSSLKELYNSQNENEDQLALFHENKTSELLKTKEKLNKATSKIALLSNENKELRSLISKSSDFILEPGESVAEQINRRLKRTVKRTKPTGHTL